MYSLVTGEAPNVIWLPISGKMFLLGFNYENKSKLGDAKICFPIYFTTYKTLIFTDFLQNSQYCKG